MIEFTDSSFFSDFLNSTSYEWLETNGLGGWASSTVSGAHTRRYHGLLVSAVTPPTKRMVLLSRLDEAVCIGPLRFELGCNQYPGAVSPAGHTRIKRFVYDMFPSWEYQEGQVRIKKTVAALWGENTTLVLYEVLSAADSFTFELQPLVAARDYHALTWANDAIERRGEFDKGHFCVRPYAKCPELNVFVPGSKFEERPEWYYHIEFRREWERGADNREDLFSYGRFKLPLRQGSKLGVICSAIPAEGRDAFELFEKEKRRRLALAESAAAEKFKKRLFLAADQFIVRRNQKSRTMIAGYPWFTDWGRDTMISLPGLCLATKRFDDAKKIISEFCEYVSEGMIPNCFPDGEGLPSYNTVDASLWFFVAVQEYLKQTKDEAFVRDTVFAKLHQILEKHLSSTRYNIHADKDCLLNAGDSRTQLTWMDAKVGSRAVTPRWGKAVEINALWYNALMISAELCGRFGDAERQHDYGRIAEKVKRSFVKVFWNEERGCLFDCVNENGNDAAVRPNQVFALSLPFELLPAAKAKSVLRVVDEKLWTPYGLRTLEAGHPDYRGRYEGSGEDRDNAYHQGTVWPWLFGAYAAAVKRYGNKEQRKRVQDSFILFERHLDQDGLNSIAEIFDGDEPQRPAGCPFQAWSVAEVLRAYDIWQE